MKTPRHDAPPAGGASPPPRESGLFWTLTLVVLVLDVATKEIARTRLPLLVPQPVLGDWFRLTLLYNPGAAFGLHLGSYSRWVFSVLAVVAFAILWRMHRRSRAGDRVRMVALGLVSGGALANFVNRLWSERGVVDFLDAGIGAHRWPAFNVADIGVTVGAALLAWSLLHEERAEKPVREGSGGHATTHPGVKEDPKSG